VSQPYDITRSGTIRQQGASRILYALLGKVAEEGVAGTERKKTQPRTRAIAIGSIPGLGKEAIDNLV
jgi:hypothetical protein